MEAEDGEEEVMVVEEVVAEEAMVVAVVVEMEEAKLSLLKPIKFVEVLNIGGHQ